MAARTYTLESTLDLFLRTLEAKNRSLTTIQAYRTDLSQFTSWLRETNITIDSPDDVERLDVTENDTHLAGREQSGVSKARKLTAIRAYFRFGQFDHINRIDMF